MRVARSLLVLSVVACSTAGEPAAPLLPEAFSNHGSGVAYAVSGGGQVDLSAVAGATDAVFGFTATVLHDGRVVGHFHQKRSRNGLAVDFAGVVTCLTIDATLGRARIGGVITQNNSTDPAFQTENHELGDDVWFRVQDGGEGDGAVDASTTYGFKPTLVNTSAEYCALPFTGSTWNPATTFPLRAGNIQVRP